MAWKVGAAKVDITPDWPVYLAGYGSRTKKHESVLAPIYARALALEAADGTRAVQISLELVGVSAGMVEAVRVAVAASGVEPAAVRLTATHTHSAPSLGDIYCGCCPPQGWACLHPEPESTSREQGVADIAAYEAWLTPLVVDAATDALAGLRPAALEHGATTCDVAVNRRNNVEAEIAKMAEAGTLDRSALNGPVDHDIELLVARAPGGEALAVAFGYACHATVLGLQSLHGDWPGRAMATLEADHPGLVALHINGCSGDANPLPRGAVPLVAEYGDKMAAAVAAAALGPGPGAGLVAVGGGLRCEAVELPLRYHTLPTTAELRRTRDDEQYCAPCMLPTGCLGDGSVVSAGARVPQNAARDPRSASWSESSKVKFDYAPFYAAVWADAMLARSEAPGGLPQYQPQPYPVSLWQLGGAVTWVSLGGEVTVGYVRRLREELGRRAWVSAYTNQTQGYIPTQRIMDEGGYEGGDINIIAAHPARYADGLEEVW
jgi:hypothetical protein